MLQALACVLADTTQSAFIATCHVVLVGSRACDTVPAVLVATPLALLNGQSLLLLRCSRSCGTCVTSRY